MKHTLLFRLWAMMTVLFYSAALAQAGQVITQDERSWAKEAMQQEAGLEAISTPNSIAVLYFNNKSGQEKLNPLQKGLAVMLITDLSKVEQLQVVERVRMQALLDEMDLGASGVMATETVPKVGKMLGAYYVASGDLLKGKTNDIAIDSFILDTPFEIVTQQPTATGALEELFKLEKEVLFNIIEQLKVPISPEKRAELNKPISVSTAALLALFLGIEHSDKGQYVEAANLYKQALVEDPNLKIAKNALQELKGMGLSSAEESSSTPPAEEGSSVGTVLGIGLAVAVLGGAAAFALSGSSGDDDDGGTVPPEQDPNDTTPPTAVASPSPGADIALSCTSGSITFSFTKTMAQSGQAVFTPSGFPASQGWQGQLYVINWAENGSSVCANMTSLRVSLNGFRDVAGNPLSGTEFFYSVIPSGSGTSVTPVQ